MLYYMERNRYLAMLHYYRWPTLILVFPAVLLMEIGMIVYSVPGNWFKTKMRASAYFLNPKNWVKIIKKRKKVSKIRKIKDREALESFEGRVLFQELNNPILRYVANPCFNFYWSVIKKIIIW